MGASEVQLCHLCPEPRWLAKMFMQVHGFGTGVQEIPHPCPRAQTCEQLPNHSSLCGMSSQLLCAYSTGL